MTQNEDKVAPEQLDEQQQQAILEKFDRESVTRSPSNKSVAWFIAAIAIFYSLFHLFITFNPLPELIQRSAHVTIGLVLIFLLYPARQSSSRQSIPWLDWLLALASLATFLYLWKEYQAIMTTRGGIPNTLDIVFAILAVVLVVEGARRVMGWMLPILGLVFLSYPFFSHYDWVPDRLLTRPYSISDIFGQMYLKTEGLYSSAIGASVTFIFLFILFGAFLAKSGMGKLFNDLAMALAGHKQGGPAKVAVISSGFMGSINGTAVANVVGTGSFTIPLMKKIGYHKNFAGAVEASASVGGQILPPVMGASAFIMAETTGVSYGTIALAATLPALLYYLGVMAQVHFRAGKDNLKGVPKADLPRVKDVLKERGHLLIPIVALVFFLFQSIPVSYAAVYTIVLTVIVASFRKSTRMGFKEILEALSDGAKQSLSVMAACAVVGIIIGVVSLTSFGSVMTSSIMSIGAGSLFLTLFFTMIASMILGMGLPSIPAYIITATMAAPALANFDIPTLVAHMFVFYFGLFANITPPVALAAFAGAGIAGGDPMRTGFQALKLSLAGFIVPFLFVYNPAMLMIDTANVAVNAREFAFPVWTTIVSIVFTSVVGILALGAAVEGYFKIGLNWFWRIFLGAGALCMIIPETVTDIIGIVMVVIAISINIMQAKKQNQSYSLS
ncbi:TRAP transporter permease [Acinetobacter johnsonii]|uniref:TRAP transporter permease n=1 Tax=Acinetobacter johnsonii TaxID=40214 RepID=UPI000738B0B3|nr:TRAP transporter permease [Acinetobacter johnsonii]AXF43282.1 TRAP transporter permease [Acinetobacter johnsonii]KUG39498.1 C4-dicarboxylate ABC transporter permease [Acinetobacter johnsonii]MDH1277546.1 TRAP transporter permease [Acinetobacter johnsonii]MDH1713112.1 TRAP transporter permease [Acinetobacter johnsonii]MDQ8974797.1 TRAP transporter permease [Acinetobacter johnsonii]